MNHYPHHIGDYDADTAHLEWIEDMAYTRLLRLYYRTERAIPADIAEACRLVRAKSKPERAAVAAVLSEFFTLEDDGWHNKRADGELAIYREKSAKASRSASARWGSQHSERNANASPNASPNAMRTHSEGNANQNQNQNQNHRKEEGERARVTPGESAWIDLPPERLTQWREAYPAVDLQAELHRALAWVHANPQNRKSNYERFLTNWLARAQERPPARPNTTPRRTIHDERAATIAAATGADRQRPAERDITPDSAVVG